MPKANNNKSNLFETIQKRSNKVNTKKDVALMNNESKSFVVQKSDGSVTTSSGYYAQHKLDQTNGVVTEISLQSNTVTVQKDIIAKDIAINFHKLNSQLYEFTNMKQVMDTSIGNLNMMGTVLVKTYEPTLEKWVLIRRQIHTPIFSNLMDSAVIDERLDLDISNSYDNLIKYKIDLNEIKEDDSND